MVSRPKSRDIGRAVSKFHPAERKAADATEATPPEAAGDRMRCSTICSCQNQRIAACESTRELCSVIEEHAAEVNHVNVSTAFWKLLQAPRAGMPRGAGGGALARGVGAAGAADSG